MTLSPQISSKTMCRPGETIALEMMVSPGGVHTPLTSRLILAAARVTSSRLLSADEALDGHGVERVWE